MKRAPVAVVVMLSMSTAACARGAPSALDPRGEEAEHLAGVWWLLLGLGAAVYVAVAGLILAAALRGRRRGPVGGEVRPGGTGEGAFIWVGGVAVPAAILLLLAVVTVRSTSQLRQPAPGAVAIEVVGKRWWWEVRYPRQGIVTANEIHVPVGQPVEIGLTSDNVIHSFWVPQLAGKLDLVPGQRNVLRLRADEPGRYLGECAEYCGLQHTNMRFHVVAEPPVAFARWLAAHDRPPEPPIGGPAARGRLVFLRSACAGCHRVAGTPAQGTAGPDLTDFGSRSTIGAGAAPNTRGHLAGWLVDAQTLKPGNLMPPVTLEPRELQDLLAYLESLE